MPRVSIKKKDYKLTDFRRWLVGEMNVQGIKQKDIADWLDISQQAVSVKIKKSDFNLKELLTLFDHLKTDSTTISNLF